MLIWLATALLVGLSSVGEMRRGRLRLAWFLSISPMVIPVIQFLWRKSYYGEWLPNTYYAKHVSAWPEAGVRYLLSFLLEHGFWIWALVLFALVFMLIRNHGKSLVTNIRSKLLTGRALPDRWLCTVVAVTTVVVQTSYYTFVIGGDHFEWRVYSYLIPFLFVSLIYFLNALTLRPSRVFAVVLLLLLFSYAIPWTHHNITKQIPFMRMADTLKEPIADDLPAILSWLTVPHDKLQDWLIDHHVCVRRQEHRLFCDFQIARYPERTFDLPEEVGAYPVAYFTTVGVPGWDLPNVAIIDGYGLNDYVIARHAPATQEGQERRMAHDRHPPEGYVGSFRPNVKRGRGKRFRYSIRPKTSELTEEKIRDLEKYWADKIIRGIDSPMP